MTYKIRVLARKALPVGIAAAAIVTLGACASAQPGAAAVVGDRVIGVSTVAAQMRSINEVLGLPPDEPSENGAIAVLSYDVGFALIEEVAEAVEAELEVGDLETAYRQQVLALGGEEELRKIAAQRGVAPDMIKRDLLTQLRVRAIAEVLAPGADPRTQERELVRVVGDVARQIGVEVSPRYGQWNPETLQITDPTNPVSVPDPAAQSVVPAS